MNWLSERNGTFECPGLEGEIRCGYGQTAWRWSVSITTDRLDESNFICDNGKIPHLFNKYKTGRWIASCEQFAAGTLVDIIKELCPHALTVKVTIEAYEGASNSIVWNRRDGKKILAQLPVAQRVSPVHSLQAA